MASSAIRIFCVPALLCLWITDELTLLNTFTILILQLLINYALTLSSYHYVHKIHEKGDHDGQPQIPPNYPTFLPVLGPLLSLIWDHGGFIRRIG